MSRLVILDGTTTIENEFNNLDDVDEIIIPQSVVSIKGSFKNCKKLKKVIFIPRENEYDQSLEMIKDSFNNNAIESISFPSSLKIVDSSFMNCRLLTSINFETKVDDRDIEGVRFIKYGSFNGTSINDLEIPPSIREIVGSFQDCEKLENIKFKMYTNYYGKTTGIRSILDDSFRGMKNHVNLPFTLQTNNSGLKDKKQTIKFKKRVKKYGLGDEPIGNEVSLYDFGLGVIFIHNDGNIQEINLDNGYLYEGFTTMAHINPVEDKLINYFGMTKNEVKQIGDNTPFNYCVFAAHNSLLSIIVRNDCIILYLPDNPSEKQIESLQEIISKMQEKESQRPGYYFSFHIYNGYDNNLIDGLDDYDLEKRDYRDNNKDNDIKLPQLKYYLNNYYLNNSLPRQI